MLQSLEIVTRKAQNLLANRSVVPMGQGEELAKP